MRVQEINFAAGASPEATPLTFRPGRITLFIGPNNGGKSQALRDISSKFTGRFAGVVLSDVRISPFTDEDLNSKIQWLSRPKALGEDPNPDVVPLGRRGSFQLINKSTLKNFSSNEGQFHIYAQWFLQHLIINLGGESRLQLASPTNSVPVREPATSTMAFVLRNDPLRKKLSELVFESFGQYLVIDSTAMSNIQYALSLEPPVSASLERSFSEEAAEFFEKTNPLTAASDGTKAFVGIMSEVMAGDHEVLLIDEPEAFLHPSLAYTLGKEISKNIGSTKQLFAATHSPHFLMGCVDSGAEIDIIRLTHTPILSTARSLPRQDLKSITSDPLLKSIGVTSALFYQEAIVCEADADRAFYAEIASRLNDKTGFKHSVFLNGYGKHTMPKIVEALRALGIPTVGIMDIDWIKEDGAVVENYMSGFGVPQGMKDAFRSARRSIRASLEATDDKYKRNGGLGVLSGEDRRAADAFFSMAREYGIFTVERGELEQWLSSVSVTRSKSKWLQEIFFALGSDAEAVDYLRPTDDDVWKFLSEVGQWLSASRRF